MGFASDFKNWEKSSGTRHGFVEDFKRRNSASSLSNYERSKAEEYKSKFNQYNYNWKSELEYDEWDEEDQLRKARGELPKAVEKAYNFDDPVDVYLYQSGLPPKKNISSYAKLAEDYNFAQEREAEKRKTITKASEAIAAFAPGGPAWKNDSVQKQNETPNAPAAAKQNEALVADAVSSAAPKKKEFTPLPLTVERNKFPGIPGAEGWQGNVKKLSSLNELQKAQAASGLSMEELLDQSAARANDLMGSESKMTRYNLGDEVEREQLELLPMVSADYWERVKAGEQYENKAGGAFGIGRDVNPLTFAKENEQDLRIAAANGSMGGDLRYLYMTPEEEEIYNFYIGRGEKEKAERYKAALQNELAVRMGADEAKVYQEHPAFSVIQAGFAGAENALRDLSYGAKALILGDDKPLDKSVLQESHEQTQPLLSKGYQLLNQVAYSAGDQAPAIFASLLNPAFGSAVFGSKVFSNSYEEAISEGRSQSEALLKSAVTSVLELGLQKVMGGISALSGADNIAQKVINGIDKTSLSGKALAFLGNMTAEGLEEYTQDILDPIVRNLAYGEDNEFKLYTPEAAESFLVGALTAGILNGVTGSDSTDYGEVSSQTEREFQRGADRIGDLPLTAEERAEAIPQPLPSAMLNTDQEAGQTPSPLPMVQAEPLPTEGTEEQPVQVGKATTIKAPYHGKVPVQTQAGGQVAVPAESVVKAKGIWEQAQNTETNQKTVKGFLRRTLESLYGDRYNGIDIVVNGTTFDGQPYNVKLFKSAIDKIVSDKNMSLEKLAVLDNLESTIQSGEYVGSGKYNKENAKKQYVTRYDYFETPIVIELERGNPKEYIASFDVEVYPDKNRFRTYRLNEISLVPLNSSAPGTFSGWDAENQNQASASDYHNSSENATQNREKISPKSLPVVEGEISKTPDAGSDIVETLPMTEDFARDGADPAEIKLNRFGDTIVESERFSREGREAVEQARDAERKAIEQSAEIDAMWHHTVQTDKDAVSLANAEIEKLGLQGAAEALETVLKSGQELDKNTVTKGVVIALQAQRNGDVQMFERLMGRLAAKGAQYGGAIQALSLAKKLSPYGRLEFFNMMIDDINAKYAKKLKGKEVSIDESLKQSLLSAKTAEEIAQAESAIFSSIAKQTPSTFPEQLRNVRYFMMLANPKTHIKNIFGNFASDLVRVMKDRVGTVLEKAIPKEKRTKTTAGYLTKEYWNARKIALKDFDSIQEMVENGTRYDNRSKIDQEKDTFNGKNIAAKTANAFIRGNTKLLSAEDTLFLKNVYADAFAQVAKARGYDAAQIQEHIGEIREYAVREAQKTTFHNSNKFADWLQKLENTGMAGAIISQGVVPFKKTPANVVTRTIEYSPAGIVKTVFENVQDATKGRFDVAKLIDGISANLTGTALVGLGAYLASIGFLNGSGSDDENKEYFDEARGIQSNSINICGRTYTIEDLGPLAAPLIIGANIYDSRENGSPNTLDDILDGLTGVASPVFELTFLQGLSDALDASYGKDPLTGLFATALKSLIAQTTKPSAVGAITRTIDGTRRDTYVSKNNKLGSWGKTVNQIKNAWAPSTLPEYVDRWGRPEKEENTLSRFVENFLLPTYTSEISYDPADIEIDRLYDATKSASVLPGKYFDGEIKYDDVSYYATPEERQRFLTTRGQSDYELVSELIDLPLYKELSDEDKADVFSAVYSYSDAKAKQEFFESRGVEYDLPSAVAKADEAAELGFSPAEWYIIRDMVNGVEYDAAYDKAMSNAQRNVIYGLPMVDWQKDGLFELFDVSPQYKKETLKKGD